MRTCLNSNIAWMRQPYLLLAHLQLLILGVPYRWYRMVLLPLKQSVLCSSIQGSKPAKLHIIIVHNRGAVRVRSLWRFDESVSLLENKKTRRISWPARYVVTCKVIICPTRLTFSAERYFFQC